MELDINQTADIERAKDILRRAIANVIGHCSDDEAELIIDKLAQDDAGIYFLD